ncbi:MAG TPA: sugar phosphate isomerase/epimerase [Planctomycetota bacterium]|nr:sugar phosphate isomerase/epimerase [Planctomycetota bacterium]
MAIALSCSTSCVPHHSRADAMRAIADAGYKYIEAFSYDTESRLHPDIVFPEQVLDDLSRVGLKLSGLNISDISVGSNLTGIKREIAFAASLRLDNVALRGGIRTERDMNALLNSLRILVPFARAHGITINIRNFHNTRVETLDDFQTVFGTISNPGLGVVLDIGQFCSSKIDPAAAIDRFIGKTHLIYTRDQIGGRVVHFGKGEIDNPGLLSRLASRGYEGFIVVEPEVHGRGFERHIKEAREYLERIIGGAQGGRSASSTDLAPVNE